MTNPIPLRLNFARQAMLAVCTAIACVAPVAIGMWNAPPSRAQSRSAPAGFEVASVKANHSTDQPDSNFPLGPGDVYVRNGGYLSATGFPLSTYISFAYKIVGNQGQFLAPQLPDWANTDRYDIRARAQSDPGKDGMRLMMRSLLADRFKLKVHYEDREVPVFAFVLAKAGATGPALRPRSEEHTSELQSRFGISYAAFCLIKKMPDEHPHFPHSHQLTPPHKCRDYNS